MGEKTDTLPISPSVICLGDIHSKYRLRRVPVYGTGGSRTAYFVAGVADFGPVPTGQFFL